MTRELVSFASNFANAYSIIEEKSLDHTHVKKIRIIEPGVMLYYTCQGTVILENTMESDFKIPNYIWK